MGRVTDLRESAAGSLIVGYGTLHECPRCGLAGLWLNKRGNLRRESFAHVVGDLAELGAGVIIRGLRAVTDFEYELGIAHANSSQAPEVYTFFLPTKPEFSFVSSSVVRELAKHGGKLDHYVPKNVEEALRKKFPPPQVV